MATAQPSVSEPSVAFQTISLLSAPTSTFGELVFGSNPNAPLPIPLTAGNARLQIWPMAKRFARRSDFMVRRQA
jgi:hypothetical protein